MTRGSYWTIRVSEDCTTDLSENWSMCILLFVTDDSMLDNAFFQYIGGIEGNYFIRVLDLDIDDDNELNYPLIMSHSSYYDSGKLSSMQN